MSAQTYSSPLARRRMDAGLCPECGRRARDHDPDPRFWTPGHSRCDLLPQGVTDRIEHHALLAGEQP